KRTAFLVSERPKYQEYYDQDSAYNNPGRWAPLPTGAGLTDPSCGTFNGSETDISQFGSYPSGEPYATGCRLYFGEWQDYGRPSQGVTLYSNLRYTVSDNLTLELQVNVNDRTSTLASSPTTAVTSNLGTLVVPADHPANPFGRAVRPSTWRPVTKAGTMPSVLSGNGMALTKYNYFAESYKLGGEFTFSGSTWGGEAWVAFQESTREYDGRVWRLSKMQQPLRGEGGPNGDQWFNPFGSADPRSQYYDAATTANSQELMDWLVDPNKYRDTHDRLGYVDVVFSGEVFDLPNGTVLAAVGGQWREHTEFEFENPITAEYDNLYVNAALPLVPPEARPSAVR